MNVCIFCKIIRGELDSVKIHEDEYTFSFLDIRPFTKGHCLVIPKNHAENIFDIDQDNLSKVIASVKNVATKIKNSLGADGINLLQSNNKAAGQEVDHLHFHIVPRYRNDGIIGNWGCINVEKVENEKLKKIADKINK